MNRQLRADGGIMQVAPREKFGLGSSIKKFVRKIIPNEVSEIAVKAAPFVAPFNPAVAAAMSGLGTFDQTGSIGDSLKAGGMNYAGGQAARYLGGAGFQDPSLSAFTPSGFKGGFSSPLGSDTGLGKFFSNRGTTPVEGVQVGDEFAVEDLGSDNFSNKYITKKSPVDLGADTFSEDMVFKNAPEKLKEKVTEKVVASTGSPNQMTITDSIKKIISPDSTLGERGNEALNLLKRGTKAAFTKSDGKGGTVIDKAAIMGAAVFASSYVEAKALAADVGVDLTEEEYDEAKKAEKKEEYASYLTNFFAGKKDGGRIGFESGTPRAGLGALSDSMEEGSGYIKRKSDTFETDTINRIYEEQGSDGLNAFFERNPDLKYKYVIVTDAMNGDLTIMPNKLHPDFMDLENIIMLKGDNDNVIDMSSMFDKEKKADGGRIGFKKGSPEESSEIGIMAIDVEAGDDDEEDMEMAAGISFNSAEKSYLFRKLGGGGGASRSYTMPMLYKILSNPSAYPNDARVLKELTIGLGLGKKDGGRIGLKGGSGSSDRVAQLMLERSYLLSKDPDEDVTYIDIELERDFGIKMKAEGGIMESKIPTGQIRKNNAGVIERDYRDEGGFVPVGIKERADDVPAMLSKNEFVMTADAVRGIGGGDVEKGSKRLYNTMKQAEKVGKA